MDYLSINHQPKTINPQSNDRPTDEPTPAPLSPGELARPAGAVPRVPHHPAPVRVSRDGGRAGDAWALHRPGDQSRRPAPESLLRGLLAGLRPADPSVSRPLVSSGSLL